MCDYISQGAFLYFTDDIFVVIKSIEEYFNILSNIKKYIGTCDTLSGV
jgi:hypothetical protein